MEDTKIFVLEEINSKIENWTNLSENDKLQTIRELKKIATIETSPIPKDSELSCPEYDYSLSVPCNLNKCSYWINSPKNFNCLYHTLDNAKKKRMTTNDIAACLGMGISEINSYISSSITKIRMTRMKNEVHASKPNDFKYIEGHCVSCGMYIADELDLGSSPNLIIEHGEFGWCSEECRKDKAIWKFKLERQFETDWQFVIILALQYLSIIKTTNREIELLLGVDPFALKESDKESIAKYKELML